MSWVSRLKFKTIFNVLGPLTNPADTKKQMIGTYNYDIAEKMALDNIDIEASET